MEELTWRERGKLWLRLGLRLALTLAAILLFWKLVLPMLALFMPFVLALALAWALNPAVKLLQKKWGASRNFLSLLLIFLVFAVAGGLLIALGYSLVGQVASFLQNWQPLWSDTLGGISAIAGWLEELLKPLPEGTYNQVAGLLDSLLNWLKEAVPRLLTSAAGGAGSFAMSIPQGAVSLLVFLMASYFISADYPNLRLRASQKVPEELRGFCRQLKKVSLDAFGGYVKAQLLLSFIIFWILLVGFFILKEPYALLLAFVLAAADFVPIIGSGTFMVPWAVIDLALGNYPHAMGLMVVWGAIAVFRQVAEPKIVGDKTGLSPILSLMSIYVGMRLASVPGMILGPVVTMVALSILRGGALDGLRADLKLAYHDVAAILRGSKE